MLFNSYEFIFGFVPIVFLRFLWLAGVSHLIYPQHVYNLELDARCGAPAAGRGAFGRPVTPGAQDAARAAFIRANPGFYPGLRQRLPE